MKDHVEDVGRGANFQKALQGLAVKENAHSASVAKATPQVTTTFSCKSNEKENTAAEDKDDDGSDIITKALRNAGILSPASSMNSSPPVIHPVSPAPIYTDANYEVHLTNREHSSTNTQAEGIKIRTAPMPCMRTTKLSSFPSLRRKFEQASEYFSKYMRFDNINPDTAASVAAAVVRAAADTTTSNAVRNDCTHMNRRKKRRRRMVPSGRPPQC